MARGLSLLGQRLSGPAAASEFFMSSQPRARAGRLILTARLPGTPPECVLR